MSQRKQIATYNMRDSNTAIYGLIGNPLGHSFSQRFFMEKFESERINAEYRNFEIADVKELLEIIHRLPNLRGLNCTIPHKQTVIPLLDELSDEARKIGAVNVIKISRSGRLKGYNSDVIGFTKSIRPLLKSHHKRALILGTGGASLAVRSGMEQLGIEWIHVSRTPSADTLSYENLNCKIMSEYQIIINCTPVGMFPNIADSPALPYTAISEQHLLYDLIYNPQETMFMKKGREQGATVKNGMEMLHLQAIASWQIWNEEI